MVNKKDFIAFVFLILSACGENGKHMPLLKGQPGSPNKGDGQKVTFESIQPIMKARCFRCHNGVGGPNWSDPATRNKSLKSGAFELRLSNKSMPQAGSPEASEITSDERQKLLAWVASETSAAPLIASNGVTASADGVAEVDVIKDRNLAFVYRCMSCHGPAGVSVADSFPNLASHGVDYIESRVTGFLSSKSAGVMSGQIKQIFKDFSLVVKEDAEGKVILDDAAKAMVQSAAQFFSRIAVTIPAADLAKMREAFSTVQKEQYEVGKTLFSQRCTSCHLAADLKPLAMAPNLFGQKLSYLEKRAEEFKDPKSGTMMPAIIGTISKDQLAAVLLYVSTTLPGEK